MRKKQFVRVCANCGATYLSSNSKGKYCSQACYVQGMKRAVSDTASNAGLASLERQLKDAKERMKDNA